MPQVFGKLIGIDQALTDIGVPTIDFQLCGYGGQTPRAINQGAEVGSLAQIERKGVRITEAGSVFRVNLVGNDEIEPPGTYYTATVRNGNGDAVQCNAYVFNDSHGEYDLDFTPPYDPSTPPPPLAALIADYLQHVAYSANPEFDAAHYLAFQIVLTGPVLGGNVTGVVTGNLYTFIINQDDVGGHLFVWPPQVHNAVPVNQDPNSLTQQTFVADSDGNLYPIGAGTYYP